MVTRRQFVTGATTLAGLGTACARSRSPAGAPVTLNDVHSQLNPTRVARVAAPRAADELPTLVRQARDAGLPVSIAGGRHAMGGQQFGAGTVLVDTTGMSRVIAFDPERGQLEVEAGIQWPALVEYLLDAQRGRSSQWGIVQKQTGADRLTIGGSLAANVHGRGLTLKPFIADVEAFTLVDADGRMRRVSRAENPALFRVVIGGYGLFRIVATVTLRLHPRRKVQRVVEVIDMDGLADAFARRIADGFLFGDCQYATDPASEDFLRRGVFSCYRPVDDRTPMPADQKELSLDDWNRLLYLAHADKRRAFELYASYYLSTNGQVYWSDTHQLSVYVDDYHAALDRQLGAPARATEIITEVYVPRERLAVFLADVRADFRRYRVDLIYGTVRLIERDDESFLAWAREGYACVIFNLHAVHTPAGLERTAG